MNNIEKNEDLDLVKKIESGKSIDIDNNSNHYDRLSFRDLQNNQIKKYIKKTTIIEEPSILSNQSDNIEESKNVKELKKIIPFSDNFNRRGSLKGQNIKIIKNSPKNKKKNDTSVYSRRSRLSKQDRISKTQPSNTNLTFTSELKSDYTRASNFEFFINDNEKNAEFKLNDNTITTTKYNIITFIPKGL